MLCMYPGRWRQLLFPYPPTLEPHWKRPLNLSDMICPWWSQYAVCASRRISCIPVSSWSCTIHMKKSLLSWCFCIYSWSFSVIITSARDRSVCLGFFCLLHICGVYSIDLMYQLFIHSTETPSLLPYPKDLLHSTLWHTKRHLKVGVKTGCTEMNVHYQI